MTEAVAAEAPSKRALFVGFCVEHFSTLLLLVGSNMLNLSDWKLPTQLDYLLVT